MLIYTCMAGDTWDLIALRIYGRERYAALLLGANPDMCVKRVMEGGEQVLAPEIDESAAATGAPWRAGG